MSDDRISDGLNAYADNVRRTTRPADGADVRRRSRQRKQRKAYAAAFSVVLLGSVGLGFGLGRAGGDNPARPLPASSASVPVLPLPTGSAAAPSAQPTTASSTPLPPSTSPTRPADSSTGKPKPTGKAVLSDVSQLKELGIDIGPGVLIDVPDDGVDRYLQIGKNGVDFTGTTKTDSTMMSLKPARVASNSEATRNRVVIQPPFWNEDATGPGYCVADTSGAPLKLELCDSGAVAQVWTVVPAGDSGQFELKGRYGIVRVNDGRITTGATGRNGLATIKFAE